MNFFMDANISYRIARMLTALYGDMHDIIHITEHDDFKHNNIGKGQNNTPDIEWISKLGKSQAGWIVITGESDIIDTAHERAALIESGLTLFSMDKHWVKSSFRDQTWKIAKIWHEIVRNAERPGPALYRVRMGHRLTIDIISQGRRARGGKFRG
jgi:hypothetical protein